MFTRNLSGLSLSSELANTAFERISDASFNGDESFTATLRALLLPRTDDNTSVRLVLNNSTFTPDIISEHPLKDILNASIHKPENNYLVIHDLRSSRDDSRQAYLNAIDDPEKGFVKVYTDFTEMTDIRAFVSNVMNARFYTSESRHSTVIFVERLDMRKWHYLQAFAIRYFKWFFESNPVTPEEADLLKSLTKRNPDEYQALIEAMSNKFDLRAYLVKKVLGDFERRARRDQLSEVERQIEETRVRMRDLMNRYSQSVKDLDAMNIRQSGLKLAIEEADSDSELIDFFNANKNLEPIESNGYQLSFIVRTYLSGFDPDMYEHMSAKPNTHIYTGYTINGDLFRDWHNRKKLLDAIFSDDPKIRVRMCAYYVIDTRGSCGSYRHYSYPSKYSDCIPNPHLYYHDCLGDHKRFINERLGAGDTVGAIAQCIASAGSINIGEGVTMKYFMPNLFNSRNKVCELPDGKCVTPQEAFQWLLDQEVAEKKEEEKHETD